MFTNPMQTVEDKTVISGLYWYASDWYGLLITVGGVGGEIQNARVQIGEICFMV